MRRRHAIIIGAFATLCAVELAAFSYIRTTSGSASAARRLNEMYYDGIREYWGGRIDEAGGTVAFGELKARVDGQNPMAAHAIAHAFGEALYTREGLRGLVACDASLAFGCFHGFITTAISNEGEAALPAVNNECVRLFGADDTGCRHGVGHGVLEAFGTGNLHLALTYCAEIQPPGLLGCTHGAFMEYMTADDGASMRTEAPDEPCMSAPTRYRPSCYFQLPNWWQVAFHGDHAWMGSRCVSLQNRNERTSCLLSVGKTIAEFSAYDGDAVRDGCARMPSEDDRWTCRAGAYWLADFMRLGQATKDEFCPPSDARHADCVAAASRIYDAAAWQ